MCNTDVSGFESESKYWNQSLFAYTNSTVESASASLLNLSVHSHEPGAGHEYCNSHIRQVFHCRVCDNYCKNKECLRWAKITYELIICGQQSLFVKLSNHVSRSQLS